MKRLFLFVLVSTVASLANAAVLEPAEAQPIVSWDGLPAQIRLQAITKLFPKTIEFLVRCNGKQLRREIPAYGARAHSFAICDKNSTLIIAPCQGVHSHDLSGRGQIIVWDLKQNKELRRITDLPFALSRILVTPKGNKIIAESASFYMGIWDIEGEARPYNLGPAGAGAFALNHDGSQAVTCADSVINIWDVESGQRKCQMANPSTLTLAVGGLTLSPDGKKVAIGCLDQIYILDVPAGNALVQIKHNYYFVSSLEFSPDGNELVGYLVGGSAFSPEATIAGKGIWSVRTGELLAQEDFGQSPQRVVCNKREECKPHARGVHETTIADNETGQLLCSAYVYFWNRCLSQHWFVAGAPEGKIYAYDLDTLAAFKYPLAALSDRQLLLINQIRHQVKNHKKFILDRTNPKLKNVIEDYDSLPLAIKDLVSDYVKDARRQSLV